MASTIKDVAQRAGVSTATVSLVLSERPGVRISEATRQRVREAARDLEFQPNIVARSLISGKSQMIGLIVNNINTPFASQVIRGVERAARERRHHVVICEAAEPEEEMDTVRWLRSRAVDGLIMVSGFADKAAVAQYVERENLPLVTVNQDADGIGTPVTLDNAAVGRVAARAFADAGYRRLGYIGAASSSTSQRRAAGFEDEAKRRKLPVVNISDVRADTPEDLAAASNDIARQVLEGQCDAVLCYNDFTAMALVTGLRAAGKSVPDDVAVIGVDNLPTSALVDPPIASVDLDVAEAGRAALEGVLRSEGKVAVTVEPHLVYRASAGRAGAPK